MPLASTRSRARAIAGVLAAFVAVACAGCDPEYNWREVRNSGDGFSVMLPGKPSQLTREIKLRELQVRMTMHGAKVNQSSFTVGVVPLPGSTAAARESALDAMREAMSRNIGGTESDSAVLNTPVIAGDGSNAPAEPTRVVQVDGQINGKPARMLARYLMHHDRVYQLVALGTDLNTEQARTFLDSFKLND